MDAEAILSVSAAVVTLVQLVKWSGLPDRAGPLAVIVLAALGVSLWGYSIGDYERTKLFGYFVGWLAVATSAAGVFGFTRASKEAVTSTTSPPSGAGASPTNR
jgi:hypothetical protein